MVQIIHNIMHDALGLLAFCRIHLEGIGLHFVVRFESVHVDMTVVSQLLVEFFAELFMQLGGEITEGVFYCEFLLVLVEVWIAFWSVGDCGESGFEFGQGV